MNLPPKIKSSLHLFATAGLIVALLFYAYGCDVKTRSLFDPTISVTKDQYDLEVQRMTNMFMAGYQDIEKKTAFRDLILQQSLTYTTTGTIDPIGVISSIMILLGVGAGVDDLKVRKKLKNANKDQPVS